MMVRSGIAGALQCDWSALEGIGVQGSNGISIHGLLTWFQLAWTLKKRKADEASMPLNWLQ